MSGHPDTARAVRRCLLLAAALTAIGASLAALPHPRDLAATADAAAPAEEEIPSITVTAPRPHFGDHPRNAPVIPSSRERPGERSLSSVEDFLRQVLGPRSAGVSSSPIGTAYVTPRSEVVRHHAPSVAGSRNPASGGDPDTWTNPSKGADSRKTPPSTGERVSTLTASTSSAYGPHAVSGMLDFIMNRHFEGIRITSSYGFYSQDNVRPVRSTPEGRASTETFARRVSATTLQWLSVTPAPRPES